jgi:3-deoxy-D-manno-octulosonate 8-phosphate phosphatase (KDO 8-P phosphatase)
MERLRQIDALVLDCDGVLTKGELVYDENGHRLLSFNVKDGAGIAMLTHAGIPVGLLSGRPAAIAEARHRELGVRHFISGSHDKAEGLAAMCRELAVTPERCAVVGDDLADLPAFRLAGLRVAVADACAEVLARADWVTRNNGGMGAVREVCEALLKAHGHWERILERFAGPRDH